ncbi:MAG: DNA/RNA non-specific endonuclease [Bacteroidales bacterium]
MKREKLAKKWRRNTNKTLALGACIMLLSVGQSVAQSTKDSIDLLENNIRKLENRRDSMYSILEDLRIEDIMEDIKAAGYPQGAETEEITSHPGIVISYNENHELANWVAHMIIPQVKTGNLSRTNDFRPDTTISTGTAVEEDYFKKYLQEDSTYEYDGYGYDRGHLAASADYRWSKQAMSATYYYSNMTPQRPEFNRAGWAKLENFLRTYVIENETPILVYTGPVLSDDLPVVERSVNKISLPEFHYKIAWDKQNNRCIAFVMPNTEIDKPLGSYAVSVDSVESLTGIDFLPALSEDEQDKLESKNNPEAWFSGEHKDDKVPLSKADMPEGAFNTINARAFMGSKKKVTVCGTVVSTHKSGKGNTFINLDKTFPNQIFTVTIWKDHQANFPYEAHKVLMNEKICVSGRVEEFGDKPAIFLKNENNIQIID